MYQIHVRLALFNLQKGLQKHQLVPPTRIWPSIYSFKKSPTKELYKRAPQKPIGVVSFTKGPSKNNNQCHTHVFCRAYMYFKRAQPKSLWPCWTHVRSIKYMWVARSVVFRGPFCKRDHANRFFVRLLCRSLLCRSLLLGSFQKSPAKETYKDSFVDLFCWALLKSMYARPNTCGWQGLLFSGGFFIKETTPILFLQGSFVELFDGLLYKRDDTNRICCRASLQGSVVGF